MIRHEVSLAALVAVTVVVYPAHAENTSQHLYSIPARKRYGAHSVWKRSARRTVIHIKKVKKRRQKVIKCCGRNRCSDVRKKIKPTFNEKKTKKPSKSNKKTTVKGGKPVAPEKEEPASPEKEPDPKAESDPKSESEPKGDSDPKSETESKGGSEPKAEETTPSEEAATSNVPGETDPDSSEAPTDATSIQAGSPMEPATESISPGASPTEGGSSPAQASSAPGSSGSASVSSGTSSIATSAASGGTSAVTSVPAGSSAGSTLSPSPSVNNASIPSTTAATSASSNTPAAGNVTAGAAAANNTNTTENGKNTTHPCAEITSNYTLSADKLTWSEAREECQKKGMDLVNLETREENMCLYSIIEREKKTGVFFLQGLNKIGIQNYSRLLSGTPLTYTDWNPGDPASFATEHCAGIKYSKWVDGSCMSQYNYICESPPSAELCDDYQGFFISSDKLTYDDAKAECAKKQMELVNLETVEENMCIQRLIASKGLIKSGIFMGLTKTGESNYTKWSNGKPLTYTDWDAGNPAQFATENCVVFFNNHWHDDKCTGALNYACEVSAIGDYCKNITSKYVISNDTKNWIKAKGECKKMGMDLASIETAEESACVKQMISKAGKTANVVLISMNKIGYDNYTYWTSGAKVDYNEWASGQPSDRKTKSCVGFQKGKWVDAACLTANYYVCESPQPPDTCDTSIYTLGYIGTFDLGVADCRKKGKQMAVPETKEENACITQFLLDKVTPTAWIFNGLDKRGEKNYTKWTNGVPLTYTVFAPGEPSQMATDDCGIYIGEYWFDVECHGNAQTICEESNIPDPCAGLTTNITFSISKLSWGAARAECKKNGMDLASIETEQENKCVVDRLALLSKSAEYVYFGLNKMGLKNYTSWFSGDAITYTGWSPTNPDNVATDDCGTYYKGSWADATCTTAFSYMCETQPKDKCAKYNFVISNDKKNYDDAKIECAKKKQSLLNLVSLEKNACFQEHAAEKGLANAGIWIGLDKIKQTNYTKWQSGVELNYTDWNDKKPSGFAILDCVAAFTHHWSDAGCSEVFNYACEDEGYDDPCAELQQNYTVSTDTKNWFNARKECKKISGDLVMLETPEEHICVNHLLRLAGKKDAMVFHGLSKMGTVFFTQWGNGAPLDYNKFPPTYNMKSYTADHCGIFKGGAWGEAACESPLAYVCELNPAPKEICVDGQFTIIEEYQNYDDAIAQCRAKNMELASAETIEENICVQRLILGAGFKGGYFWMGLSRRGASNYTTWLSGEPVKYWGCPPGEPSGYPGDECMIFLAGQWYDYCCVACRNYYICEKKI